MYSIRFKLTAIIIGIILAAIIAVFAVCYPQVKSENDRRSVEIMNLINADTSKSLEMYFESIQQSVEMAANIAVDTFDRITLAENGITASGMGLEERTQEQTDQLDTYLAEYSERVREAFASVAAHALGVITYYYCISPDISIKEHGFFYSRVGKSGFVEQPSLDARELDPADTEHTTWYYTPIQRGRPSWVGPYTAHFLDEMWITSYLVPIYKSGVLIGVLGMDIPCDTLISQVSSIQVYQSGFACLLDEEGRVIYHPELPIGTIPDLDEFSLQDEIMSMKNSGDELIRYTTNGQERQMSYTTLSNGMKLVITAPTKEINAAWARLMRIVVLISIVVIVLATALLLFSMRLITRPLLSLTTASQRLAAADYDVELTYSSKDEIGILTDSFSKMRDQLKLQIEDLNRRIYTDALTGLPNTRHFYTLAEQARKRLLAERKEPALLFFDLLGMKHFNRQYGFDEGDKLLCAFAQLLVRHYGEQCVGHFGQDHFAAVTDISQAEEELETVFTECQQLSDGKGLPVRVGIYRNSLEIVPAGVASDRAKYACDLYRGAYVSGFYYFNSTMLRQIEKMRYIIGHLNQALQNEWIQVYYQPIVRAVNGRVCDEEALARWVDPEEGVLSPADFIPILENARLIYQLDLYVLEKVLEKMQQQQKEGFPLVPHSINLSRSDFDACDIVEAIRQRVDASGIDRDKITIEVTESIIGSDFDFIKSQIDRFRELGFPVWMDDFGSGYSSLDVLHSIQFDTIKFDMSFTQRLDEGDSGKIILTEMMKMATALGLDTVCEGVETKEQVEFLQEIGCSKLQGYYYCKPVPLETIRERYRSGTQIGYENPAESSYFEAISRSNLFDPLVFEEQNNDNFFLSLPVCIMEIKDDMVHFLRCNKSYQAFAKKYFDLDISVGSSGTATIVSSYEQSFMEQIFLCCKNEAPSFFDQKLHTGQTAHFFARKIDRNPVTERTAVAIAVLSITEVL